MAARSAANWNTCEADDKMAALTRLVHDIQVGQKSLGQQLKVLNITARLDSIERRQEEMMRMVSNLRNELAGISSGMARRDSFIMGSGLNSLRRDSQFLEPCSRRSSVLVSGDVLLGKGGVPVMEVEPWNPTPEVQQVIDKLLARQFLLSPWMKEKRLRNQLRLVLKDSLEAGPQRRSTITKIVHDAHQLFPVWRAQIKEVLFENWDRVQELALKDAAEIIFAQFKHPRFPDELESTQLYAEHMIEVGQYLKRKTRERAERAGKPPPVQASITNSKFWYEVRKKINEIMDSKNEQLRRTSSSQPEPESDADDDSLYHSPASPQDSLQGDYDDDFKHDKLAARNLDSGIDLGGSS